MHSETQVMVGAIEEESLSKEELKLAIMLSDKKVVREVAKKMYKQKYGECDFDRTHDP